MSSSAGPQALAGDFLDACPASPHPVRAKLPDFGVRLKGRLIPPRYNRALRMQRLDYRMRVVLVDPSPTVLKFVTRLLEADQHEIRSFTDGREALAYIKSDLAVDALITSTEPTSMSGLELCSETRSAAGNIRPIYVILMSSSTDEKMLVEALDSGADDFVCKPPTAEKLYARLRAAERLGSMQRELIRLAATDALTGACTRRAFFSKAAQMCERAAGGGALCAIMLDIDHFKNINDLHGHDVGDEAIVAVARQAMCGDVLVGRLGGEEFALLLEGRTLTEAVECADVLRERLSRLEIHGSAGAVTLTCSFGVSEWEPGDSIDHLLKRADMALYAAKVSGRNRVVAADAELIVPGAHNPSSVVRSNRLAEAAE
jgi:diguanylate cyclase (GGDEF)-like protein